MGLRTNLKGKALYRLMSVSCAIAFMMFGFDAGVLGGVQQTKPFQDAIGNPTGTYIIPMIASSYTLAAAVISVSVPLYGRNLGRKRAILGGDILVFVGGILQATSFSVPQIIIARVLCGFGIGLISCTVPMYVAEMSTKASERGPEVAVQCVYLINGVALAYWVDFGFTRMSSQVSWRFPIGLQSLFAFISFCGVIMLPDTPRWYYVKGRFEEGDQVLAALHDLPLGDPHVQHQKKEIMDSIELEKDHAEFNIWTLFWDNTELKAGRRVRIGYLILFWQQLMGINVLVYYATVIFSQIGLSNWLSQLLAAVMETAFAMGTWFLPMTIEKYGRRPILFWSAVLCTFFMTIFVAMIGLSHKTKASQWVGVVAVVFFNFVFGFGWIGVPWLYPSEIAPLKYRHVGGAAGAFGEWSMTFVTVFAGGIALQRVGWQIWLWQLLSCLATCFFVYFMCPETGGKTLEEVDLIFMKKHTGFATTGNGGDSPVSADAQHGFEKESAIETRTEYAS